MSDIGKRLREGRDRKHLSQVQVFTKTGINNKTLSGYENGVSHPDFETLKTLAELYGVTTDHLLGADGKELTIEETEEEKLRKIASNKIQKIKNIEDLNKAIDHLDYLESKNK